MKVYLDDERPTPAGWVGVRWPEEAIRLLESGEVEEISLDHDQARIIRECSSRVAGDARREGRT